MTNDPNQDAENHEEGSQTFDSKSFLKTVPHKPGVYRMISEDEKILYVGKAKDLKNRVSSYFRGNIVNSRTYSMVKQIRDVQVTITATEAEALLLESNLIKKHQPRYNILLRDDKSYPYIYLSKHKYPRLTFHRGAKKGKGQYFGPYPSAGAVRETLALLQKLFQVRQCENSYFSNRSRPCLQYQIKRCTAPCINEISEEEYKKQGVSHTIKFLQGKSQQVIEELVELMDKASNELNFEQAANYRDQIEQLRQVSQQQSISVGQSSVDVIALQFASNIASVQVLTIRNGHNLGNKNFFPKLPTFFKEAKGEKGKGEDKKESEIISPEKSILSSFLSQYYISREIPSEILLSHKPEDNEPLEEMLSLKAEKKVTLAYKLRGDRQRWVDMAARNAQHALSTHLASKAGVQKRVLALQEELGLDYIPARMECFDISHMMGEATVASCVVFGLEGAIKSEYRRYNISGIVGGDDYAAMHQALERRYKKAIEKDSKLPDILFIDGGKGQVTQAVDVLNKLQISGVDIIGVTKGEGRRQDMDTLTVLSQEDGVSSVKEKIMLPAHSSALHLIQQVRDEAHRFAISGHRQRRKKTRNTSPLEGIEGLGPKRRQDLLKRFGGIRAITRASVEELSKVNGISAKLAQKIYDVFHSE
ncbi:excinuclease ABC subunit UvrC [Cocleimonas sp. KMM 6892]|uniref:excinuclease ABC subunit UvrC n=1 Tax=unclassified Cocleimonas TaxID=2639732 RepID=UPI002DB722E9|nr:MULTISPECIES: excinuclease ABC subunit UvrC [unclassified Cocleimonas]MEB8433473.1 excinuclease ABC subunit UvrC [Cocleimonas sp. KMM 6892]MEC4716284.1 excinuclease ABC subunit UvrC [Cocleimonas sp. KMM 6895]MEC4745823.1 excinuclease ABC subunit UvrC [Cocleimonas sp. KMM 6896]